MASGAQFAAGAAGAATAIPPLVGSGKNQRTATGFYNQPGYDPNASEFGGYKGGLDDYRKELERRRSAIDSRQAFTGDFTNAHGQRQNALEAREGQRSVAEMMLARARGQVPSVAQMQADRQVQQGTAQQAALAASARGRAGLAGAARNAASNTANLTSGISNQAQINAAMERERAEQGAYGAYTGMRQGDVASQGVDAAQAQFQAQQQQANRNANDQRAFGQEQLEGQALGQSLGAKTQNQSTLANSFGSAEAQNQQTANQNAKAKGVVEVVGDIFSSDRRAKYVLSDFTTKMPSLMPGGGGEGAMARMKHVSGGNWETGGFGGTSPAMTGPAAESFAGQAGMLGGSPMGELQAHSNFATRFAGDPSGGMAGGFMSDAKAKESAYEAGRNSVFEEMKRAEADVQAKTKKTMANSPAEMAKAAPPVRQPTSFTRDVPTPMDVSPVDRDYQPAIARQRALFAAGSSPPPPVQIVPVTPSPQVQMASFPSDFKSKKPLMGLSRGGEMGTATEGDPNAPKMQFSSSTGWYMPGQTSRDASPTDIDAFDDETRATTEEDIRRTETSRLAAQGNAMDPMAQWAARFGDPEVAKTKAAFDARNQGGSSGDSNSLEARKIRAGFAKDDAAQPTTLEAWGGVGRSFADAWDRQRNQTGEGFRSDFTTKDAIDKAELGEIQRMRSPKTFKRDTPADQARVKKAFLDKTGKDADAMLAGYKRSLNEGASVAPVDEIDDLKPSNSPVARANRTMKGYPYVYKKEFTPPDQAPGEPNFGFMAQNLEEEPVTATAVKPDPSGLKRVDALKLLRILGASVADLQEQEDESKMAISALAKGGKRRRAA